MWSGEAAYRTETHIKQNCTALIAIFRDLRTVERPDGWKGSKQQRIQPKILFPGHNIGASEFRIVCSHFVFSFNSASLEPETLSVCFVLLCPRCQQNNIGANCHHFIFCQLISSHIIPDPLYFKELNSQSARKSWMKQLSSCSNPIIVALIWVTARRLQRLDIPSKITPTHLHEV